MAHAVQAQVCHASWEGGARVGRVGGRQLGRSTVVQSVSPPVSPISRNRFSLQGGKKGGGGGREGGVVVFYDAIS